MNTFLSSQILRILILDQSRSSHSYSLDPTDHFMSIDGIGDILQWTTHFITTAPGIWMIRSLHITVNQIQSIPIRAGKSSLHHQYFPIFEGTILGHQWVFAGLSYHHFCFFWSPMFIHVPRISAIPSGKRSHNCGKPPFFLWNLTISMAIFNSKLWVITRGYITTILSPFIITINHHNHH